MKPFFIAIFQNLKVFFISLREDGNTFTATLGILLQIAAMLVFFSIPFLMYRALASFALGLIIFYVGITSRAKSTRNEGANISTTMSSTATAVSPVKRTNWSTAKKK